VPVIIRVQTLRVCERARPHATRPSAGFIRVSASDCMLEFSNGDFTIPSGRRTARTAPKPGQCQISTPRIAGQGPIVPMGPLVSLT
jgi:hypothetical protein